MLRRLSITLPRLQPASCLSTTGDAPWIVRANQPNQKNIHDSAAESILKHGFVILKDFFDADELKALTEPATSRTTEIMGMLKSKRISLGIGSRAGFREVCLRSPGRYDVPCEFEEFPSQLLERIESVASKVLVEPESPKAPKQDLGRAFAGLVRAEPKSEAQIWHADSPHSVPEHQAPHLLNVLVPLETVTGEMGPTELVPGSHLLTNHLKDDAKFGTEILYQAETNSPHRIGSCEQPVAATMDAGSVLIFDDRILHRGGHNRAACDRDVAFFSYRKNDFFPSTHYESVRSLKTYDHTAMAESVRSEFPGLRTGKDAPVLADGASGSQVHQTLGISRCSKKSVMDAMMDQLRFGTANIGGSYDSSRRAEQAVSSARSAMAQFLNCATEESLDLSRCALDANRDAVAAVVDNRTRLVAMGAASNGVGTVHDITSLCQTACELSNGKAWTFAVHYAPHGHVDVKSIGCDFLACSPYKFFGPHAGTTAPLLLQTLSYKHYMKHFGKAVEYLAQLGDRFGGADVDATMTERIETGSEQLKHVETCLGLLHYNTLDEVDMDTCEVF
eukprot:Skav225240  [mRNA]  locus=scaffold2946:280671:288190:+ [translate_table: standard]